MASRNIKSKSHKNRQLEDHITGEAKFVELGAKDAPKEVIPWDVKKAEVHSDIPLTEDKGTGQAMVIREFIFRANPEAFIKNPPTKQELFNAHIPMIEFMIMKDGFKLYTDVRPKIVINRDKMHYRIIIAATPRKGWSVDEKPSKLSDFKIN